MKRTSVFDRLGERSPSMNKYERDKDDECLQNLKSSEADSKSKIKRFKSDLTPFNFSPKLNSPPSSKTPTPLDFKQSFLPNLSSKNDFKIKSTVGLVSTQSLKKSPSPSRIKSDMIGKKRNRKEGSKMDDEDDEEEILEKKRLLLQKELELEIEREKREQEKGRSSVKDHVSSGTFSTSGSRSRCSSPVSSASGTYSSTDASCSKSVAETSQSGDSKTKQKRRSRSYSSLTLRSPQPCRSYRNSPPPPPPISRSNKSKSPFSSKSPRSPVSSSSTHRRSRNLTPPHLRDNNKNEVKLDRHGNVRISLREKEKQRNLEKERARREREKDRLRLLEREKAREKEKLRLLEQEREKRRLEREQITIKNRNSIKSPNAKSLFSNQELRSLPQTRPRSPLKSLSKTSYFTSKISTKSNSDYEKSEYINKKLDSNVVNENEDKVDDKNLSSILTREDMSPISNSSNLDDFDDSQFLVELKKKSVENEILNQSKNKDLISKENFSDWSEDEDDILLNSDNKEDLEESITEIKKQPEQLKITHSKEFQDFKSVEAVSSELQNACSFTHNDSLEAISDDEFDAIIGESQQIDSCNESQHSIAGQMMIDVLEIDWASLTVQPRPKQPFVPGSALKRFNPANILSEIGFSQKLAGPKLTKKIIEYCKNEQKEDYKAFHHPVAALHCLINDRNAEQANVFQNMLHLPNGISARKDLKIRKVLAKSLLDLSHFYSNSNSNGALCELPASD